MTQDNSTTRQQLMACLLVSEPLWLVFHPWMNRALSEDPDEAGFRVWVQTIEQYFGLWRELPEPSMMSSLAVMYTQEIQDQHSLAAVNRDCFAALQLAMTWSKSGDKARLTENGKPLLGNYLEARIAKWYSGILATPNVKYGDVVDRMKSEIQAVKSAMRTSFSSPFEGNYFPQRATGTLQPTGIDFVDKFCAGGLLDGEVVGHAAPIGQGKTTLVTQLCHARSQSILYERVRQSKQLGLPVADYTRLPQIYCFIYENVVTLLPNYISNAATIPRDVALKASLKGRDETPFSSRAAKDWRDWERKRWQAQFDAAEKAEAAGREAIWPMGELDRFDEAVRVVNAMVQLVDFSGQDDSQIEYAAAGIQGMHDYIREHQQLLGNPGVDFVAVDFVGAMADMAVSYGKARRGDQQEIIRTAPMELGKTIAGPFKCPVWAAHQLNSEENKRKGGSIPDPTATQGSAMFLTYCAVGVASGMLTKDHVSVYKLQKHRRMDVTSAGLYLAQLGSMFARWTKADNFVHKDGMVLPKKEALVSVGKVPPQAGRVPPAGGLSAKFIE